MPYVILFFFALMLGLLVRRDVMRALLPALLAGLLTLTACGELPRPFQPESKVTLDLRAPSTRAPFRVGVPEGQPPGDPRRFTLKVSEQLLTLGVPAEPQWFSMSATPALETKRLQGAASVSPAEEDAEKVEVEWSLVSPGGDQKPLTVARCPFSGMSASVKGRRR